MAGLVAYSHLSNEDVALRVNRHGMAVRKFTGLMSWPAKTGQKLSAGVVENIDLLVLFI
jgi:hypothetical protein